MASSVIAAEGAIEIVVSCQGLLCVAMAHTGELVQATATQVETSARSALSAAIEPGRPRVLTLEDQRRKEIAPLLCDAVVSKVGNVGARQRVAASCSSWRRRAAGVAEALRHLQHSERHVGRQQLWQRPAFRARR
jgi:hypothetical protein